MSRQSRQRSRSCLAMQSNGQHQLGLRKHSLPCLYDIFYLLSMTVTLTFLSSRSLSHLLASSPRILFSPKMADSLPQQRNSGSKSYAASGPGSLFALRRVPNAFRSFTEMSSPKVHPRQRQDRLLRGHITTRSRLRRVWPESSHALHTLLRGHAALEATETTETSSANLSLTTSPSCNKVPAPTISRTLTLRPNT